MISQVLIDDFYKYFFGNDQAYGKFVITGKKDKNGKIPGRAETVTQKIKKQNYIDHLEGKTGLGIVPINYDNQCRFGVLDIDDYNLNIKELMGNIDKLHLPLITIRSKSGGAHLYLFLNNFTNADIVIEIMKLFGVLLGYDDIEVFPKQKELKPGAIGNWINLPFFNSDDTERYIVTKGKKKMDLYESMKYIKGRTNDISELKAFVDSLPYKDGPPCLQKITLRGVGTGNRNVFLFNLSIYFKQKYPDEWEDKLVEANRRMREPLTFDELTRSVINSVKKKEYFYQCSQQPLLGMCNKPLCRLREFGIDNASIPSEIIGSLKKIIFHNDEVIWELDVNSNVLRFSTTAEVMKHPIYQEKCMEQLNIWPRPVKQAAWRKIISDRLAEVVEETGPEEMSDFGQFKEMVKQFLKTANIANTREQMISKNKVMFEETTGMCYFRGLDLVNFLQMQRVYWATRTKVWQYLNEVEATNGQLKVNYQDGGGKTRMQRVKVWKLDYRASELYQDMNIDVPIDMKNAKEIEDKNEQF